MLIRCLLASGLALAAATGVQAQTLQSLVETGVLPRTPSRPLTLTPLLDRVPQGDLEVSVFLTKWQAGTRTPIHQHADGGIKCLVQGEATLYIENQKPQTYSFPSCVQMPPGVPMVNFASGKEDPVFYVIFIGRKGHAYWDVTEKGIQPNVLKDFSRFDHVH